LLKLEMRKPLRLRKAAAHAVGVIVVAVGETALMHRVLHAYVLSSTKR
jgi:hypothetical protein